jgi:hypothetical protein
LENVNIHYNKGNICGGGIYNEAANTVFINVRIANNESYASGGGIHFVSSDPVLADVLISDNQSYDYGQVVATGGGIHNHMSNPIIVNMTMVNNRTQSNKNAGMYNDNSNPRIYNSITYSANNSVNDVVDDNGSFTTYDYCLIQGMNPPGNNLPGNTNPQFVNPIPPLGTMGDYHLLASSPCIDFGDKIYINPYTQVDLDGNPRVRGGNVDLGVYESAYSFAPAGRGGQIVAENETAEAAMFGEMDLSIYPNPIADGQQLHIVLGNQQTYYNQPVELKLFSIDGKQLYSRRYANGYMEADLPDLTAGIYFLTVQTATSEVYKQKVVITR